jgi:hypothetical protein
VDREHRQRDGICHDGGVTDEVAAQRDGAGEFWETEPGWVLLDGCHGGYVPFNQLTSGAMLICDQDEYARVVAGMRASGCPVLYMPGHDDRRASPRSTSTRSRRTP